MPFLLSADFFPPKINLLKKFFQEYHQNVKQFGPNQARQFVGTDQARRIVGPDLGPNCLPRLSADYTGRQRVIVENAEHKR